MTNAQIVSRDDWLKARKALLAEEKALTRARDALSAKRRAMPWVKIDQAYSFDGPEGRETLVQLFGGKSQLIVYHFMYGADWQAGCKSCSFWADNFNGIGAHLGARDAALAAVSTAPFKTLEAFRKRMGWQFKWVSSAGTTFNQDFGVSPAPGQPLDYNFGGSQITEMQELPGISVFAKGQDGTVYHSYSCYSRGLDMLNGAYHYLDLLPKGRDEQGLPSTMAWLKHHDRY
jgi:predicted dithiol-disulfide oxidoreductase (DUF899 family)